jgi:hypothetical protein
MREGINWTSSEEKDKVAYVYTATFEYFFPYSAITAAIQS